MLKVANQVLKLVKLQLKGGGKSANQWNKQPKQKLKCKAVLKANCAGEVVKIW